MGDKLENILKIFTEINSIPRKSKNEEEISNYMVQWSLENGFEVERDELLNVLVKVPGSKGYENKGTVVIQGHLDMVCEKTPDSKHDFTKDPIDMYRDGDWLKAKDTSLGADNGIAMAMAMALCIDEDVSHPPLELLFTVDEETGLTGAVNLNSNWLTGKKLINIDSEDEGVFTIGCAGGRDANIELHKNMDVEFKPEKYFKINIGGLKGGHSGVDIHEEKGNANIILARSIKTLQNSGEDIRICEIHGGSAHNAIPREASAIVAVETFNKERIESTLNYFIEIVKNEFENVDPDLFLEIDWDCDSGNCCHIEVIDLLLSVPHGVLYNSTSMKGIVETSSNVAVISTENSSFKLLMSQRSSVMSRLDELCGKIDSIVRLAGAAVEFGGGYPAWQPDFNSEILNKFINVYKELFNKEPIIEVIHAGLECGVIGSKYPGMEMISIGPTIKHPHCPDEKMLLPTVTKVWDLLVEYLKS